MTSELGGGTAGRQEGALSEGTQTGRLPVRLLTCSQQWCPLSTARHRGLWCPCSGRPKSESRISVSSPLSLGSEPALRYGNDLSLHGRK